MAWLDQDLSICRIDLSLGDAQGCEWKMEQDLTKSRLKDTRSIDIFLASCHTTGVIISIDGITVLVYLHTCSVSINSAAVVSTVSISSGRRERMLVFEELIPTLCNIATHLSI